MNPSRKEREMLLNSSIFFVSSLACVTALSCALPTFEMIYLEETLEVITVKEQQASLSVRACSRSVIVKVASHSRLPERSVKE